MLILARLRPAPTRKRARQFSWSVRLPDSAAPAARSVYGRAVRLRVYVLQPDRGWKLDSRPIGREAEVGEICAFLSASPGEPAAVAITGDVGIGKTMVWKHLVQTALRPSFRVLSCRPAPS